MISVVDTRLVSSLDHIRAGSLAAVVNSLIDPWRGNGDACRRDRVARFLARRRSSCGS